MSKDARQEERHESLDEDVESNQYVFEHTKELRETYEDVEEWLETDKGKKSAAVCSF